jgi:hypothetical protein
MKTHGSLRGARRLAVAALALATGWSFQASGAIVLPCLGPEEQPSLVRVWMDSQFQSYFPLDEKTCETITKKVVDACHAAVKDSQKCQEHLFRTTRNISRPVCDTTGTGEDACNELHSGMYQDRRDSLESEADSAHDECDTTVAVDFFDYCMIGPPPP